MGNGTKENPYTRKDVLRRIRKNGGTAKGLNLSGKFFKEYVGLQELDLREIILRDAHLEKAYLWGAHLEKADLSKAHLEEAVLSDAYLGKAKLAMAYLDGTYLVRTHLEGADLWFVKLSRDTRLWDVDWGNYILMGETDGRFTLAEETYRQLKIWYTADGVYDIAGEFFFREMEAKRKRQSWWPEPWHRGWLNIHSFISGHGERPLRVGRWAVLWILGSALIYFLIGAAWSLSAFWKSLYFSMVSFSALGYGSWVNITNEWVKAIGALESFMGVFTIALFLVTFTRKMRR